MELSTYGREFYKIQIVTDPQLTNWEASFDGGETWVAGQAAPGETNTWRWLVRGPDIDEDPANPSQLVTVVEPLVRSVDNPEVIVRSSPVYVDMS